ncbi:PLP-dependent aminotransferase family protein [Bacillus sp. V2I10]|uniref:MocR-like pyridoxine biosynthesis transcription factor PdxR n=1 Tax=Bacillus sp. V2I10 TaxID=3042276 RepID=UPI0027848590|nr:PLP-dependent aminotransferase family protein [Bacillus sp. V2I10]MDQ0859488.1 GntR family transcriptional regulator/MocR family aminotransferase [Bacillus sp. V2I10]
MLEFIPLLDKHSSVPIYVQLYQYIKQKIEDGDIPEGALLPSIRNLSGHLKISKNTVEGAYQQLLAEGYVASKSRVGLIVLPLEQPALSPSLQRIKYKSKVPMDNKEETFEYDFKYGDIDVNSFPIRIWKRCLTQALTDEPEQLTSPGERQGDVGLRKELMNYLFQSRGVVCSVDQIVICSGTQHAISLILQLLSNGDRSVAMENPSYDGAQSVFNNHGWSIKPIRLKKDGIDIEQLKKVEAKVAYITPSHQFPYGMVLPIQKRLLLLEWANQNSSFIIEDDYDSEFRYQGQPIPSLKALDSKDNVIYLGTFSKSFSPAVRVSYIVLPQSLMDAYNHMYGNYYQSVPSIIQKGLYILMNEGHFTSHIRRMRKIYDNKHQTLVNALNEYMGKRIEIIGQKAGLHLLIRVKNRSTKELVKQAKKVGVKVYDPTFYCLNEREIKPSLIMIGFGGVSEERIDKGIKLLQKAWFPNEI